MSELKLRESIVAACREMNRSGLNQGTSGNISLRWQDGLLITPTSLPYDQMTPDDIVFLGPRRTRRGRATRHRANGASTATS